MHVILVVPRQLVTFALFALVAVKAAVHRTSYEMDSLTSYLDITVPTLWKKKTPVTAVSGISSLEGETDNASAPLLLQGEIDNASAPVLKNTPALALLREHLGMNASALHPRPLRSATGAQSVTSTSKLTRQSKSERKAEKRASLAAHAATLKLELAAARKAEGGSSWPKGTIRPPGFGTTVEESNDNNDDDLGKYEDVHLSFARGPASENTPVLFGPPETERKVGGLMHAARHDRTGAALSNMLLVKALAKAYNLEYIGVFPDDGTESNCMELLNLLGLPNPNEALPFGTVVVKSLTEFMAKVKEAPNKTYYIDYVKIKSQVKLVPRQIEVGTLFDGPARTELIQHTRFPPAKIWSSKASLRVAVHIRRGDVLSKNLERRLTPNAWYISIMKDITKLSPNAEFVIFSTEPFGDRDGYRLSDFKRIPNVITRLNGPLVEAWSHMAQADVFIASESAFSKPPAILNKRVVITKKTPGFEGINGWLTTDGSMLQVQSAPFRAKLEKLIKTYAMGSSSTIKTIEPSHHEDF